MAAVAFAPPLTRQPLLLRPRPATAATVGRVDACGWAPPRPQAGGAAPGKQQQQQQQQQQQEHRRQRGHRRRHRRLPPPPLSSPSASLSDPLRPPPNIDPFVLSPHTYFSPGGLGGLANYATDLRPELIGSLLLAGGLYFGFGATRWGAAAEAGLAAALGPRGAATDGSTRGVGDGGDDGGSGGGRSGGAGGRGGIGLPRAAAETVATAVHGVPFVLAGFAVDAVLKAAGGSVLAVSIGVSTFLWAGVFEARRSSEYARALSDAEEEEAYAAFAEWASRRLTRSGRCHISGLAAAFREECPTVRVRRRRSPAAGGGEDDGRGGDEPLVATRVTDSQLRRFVQRWAPKAVRSPNGFYRSLSLVDKRKQR